MKLYFEKINNRYRGPFEESKFKFVFNQIYTHIKYLYDTKESQKSSIYENVNINSDISNQVEAMTNDVKSLFMEVE